MIEVVNVESAVVKPKTKTKTFKGEDVISHFVHPTLHPRLPSRLSPSSDRFILLPTRATPFPVRTPRLIAS